MAKWTITHSCAHRVEHNLLGKMSERDRRAEWLATQPCRECRKAAIAAQPIRIAPYKAADGSMGIKAVGETYAHREALKADGYRWDGREWRKSGSDIGTVKVLAANAIRAGYVLYRPDGETPMPQGEVDRLLAECPEAA